MKIQIREYLSSSNTKILVGKSSRDNSYLTRKIAEKEDLFFHVSDFPGSHVILKYAEFISRADLEDAAMLAAYFSKAKNKKIVKVDYTEKKNVITSKKWPLGTVELDSFKTIKVKMDKTKIDRLLAI